MMGTPSEANGLDLLHIVKAGDAENSGTTVNSGGSGVNDVHSGVFIDQGRNMNTEAKRAGSDFPASGLHCKACGEKFKNPRILPCLHTFCSECITNFQTYPMNFESDAAQALSSANSLDNPSFDSSDDNFGNKKRTILCPDCLREVEISTDNHELPRNYVIERKLTEQIFQKTNNNVPPCCDFCTETSEGSEVTARCMECSENLCYLCEQAHRRQKRTKQHQLISVKDTGKSGMAEKENFLRRIICSKHPQEELKLFCSKCDEPVCRDCAVVDHRDHKCSFITPEVFRQKMDEMQKLIHDVVPRVNAVDLRLKNVANLKDKIRNRAKQVETEINKFMDSYIQAIEKHRQALIGQIYTIVQEKERSLSVSELHLKDVKGEVGETCKLVSELIDSGSDLEILTVKKLITGRLNRMNSLSLEPKSKINDFMKFCPEEKAEVINHFQMFGKVVSRQASASHSTLTGDGLSTARISHKSVMTLVVNDPESVPYTGNDVGVRAWLIFQNEALRSIPVSITDKKEGTYHVSFTPVQKGTHYLHIAVNGQPIKDSPFKFSVKLRWREHTGVWQCCTFCQTGGSRDVPCGCKGLMPGGFAGCGHGHPSHPGGHHWSCCGKMVQNGECLNPTRSSPLRQVTL